MVFPPIQDSQSPRGFVSPPKLAQSVKGVYNPLSIGLALQPGPGRNAALQPEFRELKRMPSQRFRLTVIVVALSALAIVLAVAAPPHGALDKADLVGYAICHRIPERSFFLAGRQMPLCARCTGTFLGGILGLVVFLILQRGRASRMPPVAVLGALILFMALWGFDGLNSYLTFFPGAPHLYVPQNWLRLTTGTLNGLALITFLWPIFNFTLWREPSPETVIKNPWELVAILPAAALLILVVQAQIGFLLYPLAILSSLGVVILLVLINSMIATFVLGREAYARTWRQALVPITCGAALAFAEVAGLVLLRDSLTTTFGLPF